MITQERLKEILDYNSITGLFINKVHRGRLGKGSIAGYLNDQGYIIIKVDKERYRAHRLAWLYVYGSMPTLDIDHIDRNRSNNAISNLREVTPSENAMNIIRKPNKTGYLGVVFSPKGCILPYKAQIKINKKQIALGTFATAEEAHDAYLEAMPENMKRHLPNE